MDKKAYWTGVVGQFKAHFRRFFRDKTSLFFTFLFPLIFLFIFGSIFRGNNLSFKIALFNNSETEFAKHFEENARADEDSVLKIQDEMSWEEAREKMKRSQIDAIIELPANFGEINENYTPNGTIKVFYSKGAEQTGSTLTAIFGQITAEINKYLGHPEAPLQVVSEEVGDPALSSFDYTFTGLLGFSMMSMGVFGLANMLPTEKQKGSFRRLRSAPFTADQLLIAYAMVFTIVSLISVAMMLLVGHLAFNFTMRGSWLLFWAFAVLSASMMVGLGLLVGGWAKNENQSAPLSNLVSFPMMFLSGAFFPAYLFPEWLQKISQVIPMSPVVDGFRMIMTEQANVMEILPQLLAVLAWVIAIYFSASKLFRWE